MFRLEKHYFTSTGPPPWGPHISLSYSWQLQWREAAYGVDLVCLGQCTRGSHLNRRRGVDGRESWKEWRMRDVGNRKMGAGVSCCAAVGWKSWPAVEENWQIFLEVLKRVGGICLPSDCLSESECENKTVCQPVSHEKTLPARNTTCLIPNHCSYVMFSKVMFLYFGMYPVLTQVDSDAERSKQSNNNKSQLFFHCQFSWLL